MTTRLFLCHNLYPEKHKTDTQCLAVWQASELGDVLVYGRNPFQIPLDCIIIITINLVKLNIRKTLTLNLSLDPNPNPRFKLENYSMLRLIRIVAVNCTLTPSPNLQVL